MAAGLNAQTAYTETEPNDTKDTANGPFVLAVGDTITGNTQGAGNPSSPPGLTTSADYFRIKIAPAAPAIYRNRLGIVSAGTLPNVNVRGRAQVDGALSFTQYPAAPSNIDATIAGSSATVPYIQWYGFGREEELYIRTNGTTATTSDYTLTYSESMPVTPIDGGTMPGGVMTITTVGQGHTTDTDLWVYDSNLNAIPGYGNNNGPVPGDSNRSRLTRDFAAPGDYYIAISNTNLVSNLLSVYPEDLDPNEPVLDFPNVVMNNQPSVTSGTNVALAIIDGDGVSHPIAATRTIPFEVVWVKFTVTAPVTGSCCMADGTCTVSSQAACALNGSAYGGDGSTCGGCTQPATGSCCVPDTGCSVMDQYACAAAGGYWGGAGTTCGTDTCKQSLYTCVGNSPLGLTFTFFAELTATDDLTLSELDYTPWGVQPATASLTIYTRPGSYLTHDNDPTGWTLSETVTGVCHGRTHPIHAQLAHPIAIHAGEVVSLAFKSVTGGIYYASQLTGTLPTTYSNGDLQVFSDRSRSALFGGTLSQARTWSGRFYYSLGVPPTCGTADFNCDGDIGTDADIEAFFVCLSGSCPAAPCTSSADFNGDGDTGTDGDIEAFFRVLAGGTC
jgi:hypothetical protein